MTRLAFGLCVILGMEASGTSAFAQKEAPSVEPSATSTADTGTASAPATKPEAPGSAARRSWEDIVVVARKPFLKSGRLELAPFSGVSVNDTLIRHYSFGGDLNYYLTDVFAVGLQGQYFLKERTDREGLYGLQFNRIATLNRYKYAGALNFSYVPGYGKFGLFNRYIFHWDIFASAGVGVVVSEIIPRVPGNEAFTNMNIAPNVGAGTRLFLTNWLTFSVTFRDYIFNDKFEPTDRMAGEAIEDVKSRASTQFVNHMMLFASVGIYLPTSFQYRTPR